MAEDSYNDPNRKYKCHRCKVAFTRQSYLTSHNKTLLHRKGEKMSYPMEKYLDPNRPFKCDICMESFTQKNILLVHYNSVSHLHKVKLSMKENSNNSTVTSSTATSSPPVSGSSIFTAPSSTSNSSIPALNSPSVDTEKKPFKCNICKVAYSQGSTLDIHVRSVLHQTRASKLHELAVSGQIDLTAPLIERPEQSLSEQLYSQSVQSPNVTNESSSLMLPQTSRVSGPATSVPSSVQAPKIPDLTQVPLSTPASSAAATITSASPQLHLPNDAATSMAQALGLAPPVPQPPVLISSQTSSQALINCSRCNAIFMSHDSLIQHQQLCCFFNPPPPHTNSGQSTPVSSASQPFPPPTTVPTIQVSTSRLTSTLEKDDVLQKSSLYQPLADTTNITPPQLSPQTSQLPIRPRCPFPRPRPLVYKHLIESFGFDVVMHFNENNQRRRKMEKKENEENQLKENKPEDTCKSESKPEEVKDELTNNDCIVEGDKDKKSDVPDLPEINKSVCDICSKEFSCIWVLKTHREEIHKEVVPFEFLLKFAESYRALYEKQNNDQLLLPVVLDENVNDLNAPATSVSSEAPLCPTPSSVTSSTQQPPVTPPATSLSSQLSDVSSSVTANQMAAQLQFNQLLMSMGLGMGLPMGMNLNMPFAAAAAMNLHPPLIPVLLPPPMDPLMASAFNHPMMPGGVESSYFAAQQKMLHHQQQQQSAAVAAAQAQQQKRARTRINDEQLKILRTYFDINNSPTEEQLIEMSDKSGLPLKVIKHWFRNTLFKERQRNKDSPYNFNNPPSTFLNLEEYEKTGEAKVVPINRNDFLSKGDADSTNQSEDGRSLVDDTDSSQEDKDKHEHEYPAHLQEDKINIPKLELPTSSMSMTPSVSLSHPSFTTVEMKTTSAKDENKDVYAMHSESSTPSPQPSINFSSVSSITGPIVPNASTSPPTSDSPRGFNSPSYCGSGSTGGGTGSGKRANRTRFTDYQIKVLQEFFETNAYPKDDDLEYLSKLLSLSPRVIVVWFQNARQKARKVYENQPPINTDDDSAGKFQRTPGLNYQCKKCLQVFQRYYELIKHQKSSCFKDENPLAIQMKAAASAVMDEKSQNSSVSEASSITNRTPDKFSQNGPYRCDKCSLSFIHFDHWKEHQIVHIMNPNLFPNYSPNSSFGILQYEAQQPPTPPLKRKLSEEEELKDCGDQPKDKRLRTTILPEQLDYLYQKYQVESNPSRKMLENIAREVGLKKRVVQVWFQNTRARERKGQFRAHQQVIHKRCPFCRALFKARSALESHLATRHADQYTRGDINIDSLPDGEMDSNPETPSTSNASEDIKNSIYPGFSSNTTTTASAPSFTTQNLELVQSSMKKYYEDSLKKYLDDLVYPNTSTSSKETPTTPAADLSIKPPAKQTGPAGDSPLDLSKPVKVSVDGEKSSDGAPTNLSDKSYEDAMNKSYMSCDDARSETHSESTENMDFDDHLDMSHESNPTSPSNSGHHSSGGGKRFRTQMSTIQLKVMKSIFADYKTPSMAECETLGREIGLPKRVVQVWFQNARAKEKKAKLAFMKAFGHEMDMPKLPEECTVCKVKYNIKFSNTSMQDHLFSKRHLENLKIHITKMKKLTEGQDSMERLDHSPNTPSSVLNHLVHSQHNIHQEETDMLKSSTASSGANPPSLMQQLHMMGLQQMPGMPMSMGLPGFSNASNGPSNAMGMNAAGSPPTSASSISSTNTQASKTDSKEQHAPNKCNSNTPGDNIDSKPCEPSTSTSSQRPPSRKEDKKDVSDVMNGGNNNNAGSVHPSPQRAGNMADFPMPTTEAGGLFPYMYAGFPGYYAGLSGAFFHPGMYPGRNKL